MRRLLAAAAIALALAGCAAITEEGPGPYTVDRSQTVTLGRTWSDVTALLAKKPKRVRLLSVDGPYLNRLYVTGALAPGDMLARPLVKEQPTPLVRADMTPTEKIEFVVDSVALEYQRVEAVNPRPAQMGGADAIRFDLKARTSEGLDIAGAALVGERDGRLYVLLFLAPAEHYYGALLPEVERVMASARAGG